MIFLDASALVKVYLSEQGSGTIRGAVNRMAGKVYLTPHVILETLSAFARLLRGRVIRKREYLRARSTFLAEVENVYTLSQVSEVVFAQANDLVHQNRRVAVGALDVLHVASALDLQASFRNRTVVLASADKGLLTLARAAGVRTFNPEVDPLAVFLSALN